MAPCFFSALAATLRGIMKIIASVLLTLTFAVCAFAQQPKSLFYMTREPDSVRSFLAHADKVDIVVPAWYTVDDTGLVSGGPNPLVMETARQHNVEVMPIVAGANFVQAEVHKLLHISPKRRSE